jgi:hypothetical protein
LDLADVFSKLGSIKYRASLKVVGLLVVSIEGDGGALSEDIKGGSVVNGVIISCKTVGNPIGLLIK